MSKNDLNPLLSWLGAAAVAAGCATAAWLPIAPPAFAQLTHLPSQASSSCRSAAAQQVTTSAVGQPQGWSATAFNTLCNGVETSTDPATCFSHVMTSNSVNYGGGTNWNPNNALRLCAGASNAQRRISCFDRKIGERVAWGQAIDQCIAEERTLNVQVVTPTAPRVVTAPVAAPAARAPTVEEIEAARRAAYQTSAIMDCQGPLRVEVSQVRADDARQGTMVQAFFTAATSASDMGPGKCWRRGGWGNGALMGSDNQGVILYQAILGTCPLVSTMRFENGALAEITTNDRIVGMSLIELGRSRASMAVDTTYLGRVDSGRGASGPTRYTGVAAVGASTRPGWCQ
jgi:hypothetical protein